MYIQMNGESIEVKIVKTLKEKIIYFYVKKRITCGLLLPNVTQIRTFFMKDNIDVLFIDHFGRVLYKYENMPVNRTFKVYEEPEDVHCFVLPKNSTKGIYIGSVLCFKREHVI